MPSTLTSTSGPPSTTRSSRRSQWGRRERARGAYIGAARFPGDPPPRVFAHGRQGRTSKDWKPRPRPCQRTTSRKTRSDEAAPPRSGLPGTPHRVRLPSGMVSTWEAHLSESAVRSARRRFYRALYLYLRGWPVRRGHAATRLSPRPCRPHAGCDTLALQLGKGAAPLVSLSAL